MKAWNTSDADAVRIKICGVQCEDDIEQASLAGADAVGLMLALNSPRSISLECAKRLTECCGNDLCPVTVLANPSQDLIDAISTQWVQLHGDESDAYIEHIALSHRVVKAVPAGDLDRLRQLDALDAVERLLVDAPIGGSGQLFDHEAFAKMRRTLQTPLIVAGGLNPDTVQQAIVLLEPWGVDVSSGVERTRGKKDPQLMQAFCSKAR